VSGDDEEVLSVAMFALIHGAGDVGWYWHLVDAELSRRGHDVVAPDLPCDDNSPIGSRSRCSFSSPG
jgi:pimeloyl-ACP methyl ester carboxylesterase